MEFFFGVKDTAITWLGRKPDLTTRVPMWEHLLSMVDNPLIGTGYESFWLGARLIEIQERWGNLKQAHNGYIEMYLNLGILGIFFVISWVWAGVKKIKTHLATDYPAGVLRFCIIVVVLFYNYTEATFFGISNMWVLFLFAIMNSNVRSNANKQKSYN
jgi:O-antigen ligase